MAEAALVRLMRFAWGRERGGTPWPDGIRYDGKRFLAYSRKSLCASSDRNHYAGTHDNMESAMGCVREILDYYFNNYGTNWVSTNVLSLLHGEVDCVVLPYDRLNGDSQCSLRHRIREEKAKGYCPSVCNLAWQDALELHPLSKVWNCLFFIRPVGVTPT